METEKTQENGSELTVYEVSYLLLPSLAVEQVPAKASSIKEMIKKVGGEVLSDEDPVLVDLAYPMTKVVQTDRFKVQKGYFGWIKYELSKETAEEVKKALDADNDVLRHLIIKTVRENTLLAGKMKLGKEEKMRLEESEEVVEDTDLVADVVVDDAEKVVEELNVV